MLLHVISAVLDLLFVGAAQRHVVLTVGWTWCTYGARRRIFILHIYMHTHTHTHTHAYTGTAGWEMATWTGPWLGSR